GSPPKKKRKVG
nr:Chain B, SV40TAGNLS [Betapolyomavirus macacae]4B8O_C Chain C, SV40TAGNLS [Betapolyomavirus macacae]